MSADKGMLERDRFLVQRQAADPLSTIRYLVRDADDHKLVGTARTRLASLDPLVRGIHKTRFWPTWLDVYEVEDEPLLFTVRCGPSLLRFRARIVDADGSPVGRFLARGRTAAGGFWIADRYERPFAEGRQIGADATIKIQAEDGRDLATWRRNPGSADLLVELDPCLSDFPIEKMLLLGSALAFDQQRLFSLDTIN